MLWSGSSPLAVVRAGMWGFLLFAGAAWLAIAWSVMRLQPSDVVYVAGPVVLFGALTEAVRALAGTRTWWLNAGMAVLFAVTGCVLLGSGDSSFTTPAALLGWYLMVRGAADVAVSMMTRESDRIWGLLMVVGVVETALGFFAASPLSRTADLVVTVLGGLALVRGVADLVAALRLREVSPVATDLLVLPPERAAGVAGYSAGLSDYETAPAKPTARHRAPAKPATGATAAVGDWSIETGSIGTVRSPGQALREPVESAGPGALHTPGQAVAGGMTGAVQTPGHAVAGGMAGAAGFSPGMGESVTAGWTPAPEWTGPTTWSDTNKTQSTAGQEATAPGADFPSAAPQSGTAQGSAGRGSTGQGSTGQGSTGHGGASLSDASLSGMSHGAGGSPSAAHDAATHGPVSHRAGARGAGAQPAGAETFHDEVLRTTADLDAMLALAGVTGAAVGASMVHYDGPEVPDTPEGVELSGSSAEQSDTAEMRAVSDR